MNGIHLSLAAFMLVWSTGLRWVHLINSVALPEKRGGFLFCMLTGFGLSLSSFFFNPGWIGGTLSVLALLPSSFFIYTWSISGQQGGAGKLQSGTALLAFTGIDDQGNLFDSRTLDGQPVLLKFFRGHW